MLAGAQIVIGATIGCRFANTRSTGAARCSSLIWFDLQDMTRDQPLAFASDQARATTGKKGPPKSVGGSMTEDEKHEIMDRLSPHKIEEAAVWPMPP
jgi:hypothetical protein